MGNPEHQLKKWDQGLTSYPKRPIEFYGHAVTPAVSDDLALALEKQVCPFLQRKCIKVRKSNATQTIGACTVGYGGKAVMICPHRFIEDQTIFRDAVPLLGEALPGRKIVYVPEITMPGGNVDYFVVSISDRGHVVDYVGLEIQTLDTTQTGGIWDAREDLLRGIVGDNYNYGMNWKMTAKTILIQLHHKAAAFEAVKKHLVLTIRREFFEYLKGTFNTLPLHPATPDDSVHFHVYSVAQSGGRLKMGLSERYGCTAAGVELMLKMGSESVLSREDIESRIRAKLHQARAIG